MAAITQYQPYGLPGKVRSFIAKTAAATVLVSIIGASGASPAHIPDEGQSLLIQKDLEVQRNAFFGGVTNYIKQVDGDMVFVGAAGLSLGSFWGNDIDFTVAGGTGTFKEITDADITVGLVHNVTFQNNKELAITNAGWYDVIWSISAKATGANKHIVGAIGVDAGGSGSLTAQNDGRNHAVSTGNAEFSISGAAILDLSASSEVGLMVTNETDNTNVTIEHVNLIIGQRAGT